MVRFSAHTRINFNLLTGICYWGGGTQQYKSIDRVCVCVCVCVYDIYIFRNGHYAERMLEKKLIMDPNDRNRNLRGR